MSQPARETSPLLALLRRHEKQIASTWAETATRLPDSHYGRLSRRELTEAAARTLQILAEVVVSGSYSSLESNLANVTRARLEQGFDIGEVIEGLMLLRETVVPLVFAWDVREGFPHDTSLAREMVAQLDAFFRHAVGRFGRLYAEAMHQDLLEQQRRAAALAVDNARLYEETRRRLAESESLQRVTAALLQKLDLGDVLEIVCSEAQRLTGARGSAVFLLEGEEWLRVARSTGIRWPNHDRLPVAGSFTGMAVREGVANLTNDPRGDQRRYRGDTAADSLPPLLAVPLRVRGTAIGALDAVDKPEGFTQDDLRLMGLFADQAAIAIENARLVQRVEQLAVMEERQRLARELHDSVTQSLYSMTLFAEAAVGLLEAGNHGRAAHHLQELRDTAQEALREMRLLIYELHPPVLEKEGLVAALQARLGAVEVRGGLQAKLRAEGDERLPIDVEEELYRIAQEALNNVLKHARASKVTVRLRMEEGSACLEVSDDGVGFDPAAALGKGGLGLSSMQERAQKLGAKLQIESAIGQGTSVRVEVAIPITERSR